MNEDVGGFSGRWFDDAEKKRHVKSWSELTSSKFLTSRITTETISCMPSASDARDLLERQQYVMETSPDEEQEIESHSEVVVMGVLDKIVQRIWPWWVLKYFLADQMHAKINDL